MTYKIIGADGAQYGPVTAEELRAWIAEGRANGQTQTLALGATEWKPLALYMEFASALVGAAPPSPGAPRSAIIAPLAITPRTNPMAVAGFVLGIISLTFGLCCCYGMPFNVLGVAFSAAALAQIKGEPGSYTGRWMAIAGLVLNILSLLLAGLSLAFHWDIANLMEHLDD